MPDDQTLYNSVAPLRNVMALTELIERVEARGAGLPGMACFYGPSGYGKTTAATFACNTFEAFHVQVKSVWRPNNLCEAIMQELGLTGGRNNGHRVEIIAEHLAKTGRPLLVDEADHLVRGRHIEIIRDIHEASGSTVILIGEEQLPGKLEQWERVHGRMLDWVAAEQADAADVDQLARLYAPGIDVSPELKEQLLKVLYGSIRRICVNLSRIREEALRFGKTSMGLADWPEDRLFTGKPPLPRRVRR